MQEIIMEIPAISLVEQRQDIDIQADAERAILSLDTANSTGIKVKVGVAQGQVTLTGHLRSEMIAAGIERAVRAVNGVDSVVSHLVNDSSLVRRLATALASDARTQPIPPGYQVQSAFGRVLVVGVFDNEARLAIGQVCSSVPGVRSVQIRSLSDLPMSLSVNQPRPTASADRAGRPVLPPSTYRSRARWK